MEKIWLNSYDQVVPQSISYPNHPLGAYLEQAAAADADKTALLYRGGALTYGRLNDLVNRFAAALCRLGLKKGDRVAIQLPTCPQFVIAYYAALKMGAVAVPLNPAFVAREMAYYFKDSGAALLVTSEENSALLEKMRGQTALRAVVIAETKSIPSGPVRGLGLFSHRRKRIPAAAEELTLYRMEELFSCDASLPETRVQPADAAVIMYTAGSSGTPLGAVLTHANLTANVLQCRFWNPTLVDDSSEIVLVALPLSHSYGMTIGMNLGLATASQIVLMPRFDVGELLDLIERYRVTHLPGVPAMFEAVLKAPDLRKYNLRSIKTCLSGGAPLPLEVQQSFERVSGGKLIEGYGLAEASPVTHVNPYLGARRTGSIGLPLPDTDVKVVDIYREDKELPPGAVGELCIRGPQVMQGYFNCPEETAGSLKNGWLSTGDIVRMEDDGFAYIVDRKKDLIISGGYNIYPAEIRAILLSHPDIKQAIVSGIRDPYKGESLQVVIYPRQGSVLSKEDVLSFCRENLAEFKIPREIEIAPV